MKPRTCSRPAIGLNIATRRRRRVVDWRHSDSDEGSVIVEFALVFPIFAIMLFGMIQFGFVFNGWTSQRNSVQTAARLGSINDLGSDCTEGTPDTCSSDCPLGTSALNGGADLDTANMICTASDLLGQPVGITGTPKIDLLVQNGLLTVCSQVQAEPLTGLFPSMTLSTTSSFYIDQPGSAPLSATDVTGMTSVTGGNNTLSYDIDVSGQGTPTSVNATIVPSGNYDPSGLATAIQAAINSASTGLPQYEIPSVTVQNNISTATATIEFTLAPELDAPDVEIDNVGGSATTPPPGKGFLTLSGASTDNDLLESYNPDAIPGCAANTPTLTVSAPSTDSLSPTPGQITISGLLDGATSSAGGTVTFGYFEQPNAPTDCSNPTPAGTVTVSGDGIYTANFTPTPPAGNYWWYASYSGDSNNAPAASVCGNNMAETVVQ